MRTTVDITLAAILILLAMQIAILNQVLIVDKPPVRCVVNDPGIVECPGCLARAIQDIDPTNHNQTKGDL